ncbi:MAG: ATP-binding protein [Anaerolineae bacterium]|nr:ATP-binding protein [Anaerolineae bacterium]
MAREALNNTLKHAQASSVKVHLCRDAQANRAVLEIVDDGVGFDPGAVQKGGMGMPAMAERAEELGGKLEITRPAGGGTRVVVEVPV